MTVVGVAMVGAAAVAAGLYHGAVATVDAAAGRRANEVEVALCSKHLFDSLINSQCHRAGTSPRRRTTMASEAVDAPCTGTLITAPVTLDALPAPVRSCGEIVVRGDTGGDEHKGNHELADVASIPQWVSHKLFPQGSPVGLAHNRACSLADAACACQHTRSQVSTTRKLHQQFVRLTRTGRPDDTRHNPGGTIELAHPAFYAFQNARRHPSLHSPRKVRLVAKLCAAMCKRYGSAKEREAALYPSFQDLMHVEGAEFSDKKIKVPHKRQEKGKSVIAGFGLDAQLTVDTKRHKRRIMLVEVKNELASSGSASIQGAAYYMTLLSRQAKNLPGADMPMVLCIFAGAHMRVFAAITQCCAQVVPLTEWVSLATLGDSRHALHVTSVFHALLECTHHLVHAPLAPGVPAVLFPRPAAYCLALGLHGDTSPPLVFRQRLQRGVHRAWWKGVPVVVKVSEAFGIDAQRLLAATREAPAVLEYCHDPVTGLHVTVMEDLRAAGFVSWSTLAAPTLSDKRAAPNISQLRSLVEPLCTWLDSALQRLHDAGIVYGDLREPNLMVRVEEDAKGKWQLDGCRLVDFEFCGKLADGALWPTGLNTALDWPEGVFDGEARVVMLPEHDAEMVAKLMARIQLERTSSDSSSSDSS